MAFKEYFDLVPRLELPIRGRTYEIPFATHDDMTRWKKYRDRLESRKKMTASVELTNEDFARMFLGDALDAMRADGVPAHVIQHSATVALADAQHGREVAEQLWSNTNALAEATSEGASHE